MSSLAVMIDDERTVAVYRLRTSDAPTVFATATELSFAEDGSVSLGPKTAPGTPSSPVLRGFASRIGQSSVHSIGVYRPEDLYAHAVNCVVALVTAQHNGLAPAVAVAHPQHWTSAELDLLVDALEYTGLHGVLLVPADEASAAFAALPNGAETDALGADQSTATARGALTAIESPATTAFDAVGTDSTFDAVDTDSLPILTGPAALAFSEAPPQDTSSFASSPDAPPYVDAPPPEHVRRRTPLIVVTAAAVVVVLASIGIAAALGTFSGGSEVPPPAIIDADNPTTTPSQTGITTSSPVPFATAPQAPDDSNDGENPQPTAPLAPVPEPVPTVEVPAEPDPEAATVPTRTRGQLPPRPTVPKFTYPTIPKLQQPGE